MKKFSWKKALLMSTSLVLTAVLAIGGTLAYLQSEDSDVNVMTLGNVEIEQIEQERDANGNLVDFTQGKPAYPVVGPVEWAAEGVKVNDIEYKVFTDDLKNVVDKIVTVNNIGKSDAYVRTLVAIEAPDYDPENLIHINWNSTGVSISDPVEVEINGVDYVVFAFTYEEALASGEKSAPSLMQLFLDSAATNEDCEKFGNSWDVMVLSQAVQTEGFADAANALDTAFGEPDAINPITGNKNVVDWFTGVKEEQKTYVISSVQELKDAMLVRGAYIILDSDLVIDKDSPLQWGAYMFVANGREVTIDLNGKSITVEEDASLKTNGLFTTANGGTLNIVGDGTMEIKNGKSGIFHAMNKNDQINVYGGTYISNSDNGSDALAIIYTNSGNVDVYGGEFISSTGIEIANAEDRQGNRLSIVFHEGALLNHKKYYAGYDATRIQLEEGFALQEVTIDGEVWYQVVKTEYVTTAEAFKAALAEGGHVTLKDDIVVTDTVNITNETHIDLSGNNLTVSVLEAKADTTISNGTITHGQSTYPALSVSAGTLTLNDVTVVCEEPCNIVTSGSAQAAEYAALEIWGGNCVLNDCDLVAEAKEVRYSNSIFAIGIHSGELTMNGGSLTVKTAGSTKEKYDYASAIFTGSDAEKVINLNEVDITIENTKDANKTYSLLYAWGGNTIVNTTDDEDSWNGRVDARNGGTYTINYAE